MPYLYTAAEETSRDGVPIMRPLFVEFPHAASDEHPLDLDASGEFFFGPALLVAASPSPEEVAPYEVHLPPGVWYDYWTGAAIDRRAPLAVRDLEIRDTVPQLKPILVTPKLDELPIYVRAGAILPMQPLTESTSEIPQGPLMLRVYPPATGEPCSGDLYQDDGLSFDFQRGKYLRLHFTCSLSADGALTVNVPMREGSFVPWWKEMHIEAVGWAPQKKTVSVGGRTSPLEKTQIGWAITLPDNAQPQTITMR